MLLRARAWVRFDWQNDWGTDQVSDCASATTLVETSVIALVNLGTVTRQCSDLEWVFRFLTFEANLGRSAKKCSAIGDSFL